MLGSISSPWLYREPQNTKSPALGNTETAEEMPVAKHSGWHQDNLPAVAEPEAVAPAPVESRPASDEDGEFIDGPETGVMKFYDPIKGFGFVVADTDGEDVFFHRRQLDAYGMTTVAPGSTVTFVGEMNDRDKPQVETFLSIDESTATGPALKPAPVIQPETQAQSGTGRVTRWTDKGYGFVTLDDGQQVFVHKTRAPGGQLDEESRVRVTYAMGDKGLVAITVYVL